MTTVLDVDKTLPEVERVAKTVGKRPVQPRVAAQTKWVNPRNRIAVDTLRELADMYVETAEYIEEKAVDKKKASPDRMVSGYLIAAANQADPIGYLADAIQKVAYAVSELRMAMQEVVAEERRQKADKK